MKVLMVCLGNICRSPLAEGLLANKVRLKELDIEVDSAGTSGHHAGNPPDYRMQETALQFGVSINHIRSRQFVIDDFDAFDLIFVMDTQNYNNVIEMAQTQEDREKVKFILNELYPRQNRAVPDPYYGGEQGFEKVYQLLDEATDAFLSNIKEQ